jgi:large conductance mechanosensitive channel
MNYGLFVNSIISFVIVALAVFFLVRMANRMMPKPAAAVTTRDCPYCKMPIPLGATRCPQCTSELRAA